MPDYDLHYDNAMAILVAGCKGRVLHDFVQLNHQNKLDTTGAGLPDSIKDGQCMAYSTYFLQCECDYVDFIDDVNNQASVRSKIRGYQQVMVATSTRVWEATSTTNEDIKRTLYYRAFHDVASIILGRSGDFIMTKNKHEAYSFVLQNHSGSMFLLQVSSPVGCHCIAMRNKTSEFIFFDPNFYIASFPIKYAHEVMERYLNDAWYDSDNYFVSCFKI